MERSDPSVGGGGRPGDHWTSLWLAVGVGLTGLLLYANTLAHGYVLDDSGAITMNPDVLKGVSGIPGILTTQMWHIQQAGLGYYRPLSLVTFAIEQEFFPGDPRVGHLMNVLLYALTGFVLCRFLTRVFRNSHPFLPFLIALLFIAHPVHTEVVANIKSRDELLAFLCLVGGSWLLLKASEHPGVPWRWLVPACGVYYLSLLSKESAFVGPLFAVVVLHYARGLSARQALLWAVPFTLMVSLFLLQKALVLGSIPVSVPRDIVNYPYAQAGLPSAFLILLHCIRLIMVPHPLTFDYSYDQIPAAGSAPALAALGYLLAATLLFFGLRGLRKKSASSFGILVFGILLAPALGFVYLRGGILAERFLYAPVLGFCIAVVFGLARLVGAQEMLKTIPVTAMVRVWRFTAPVFVVLALFSLKTVTRNQAWHDNFALFSTDVRTSANSCKAHVLLGYTLIDMGIAAEDRTEKAERFAQGAAELRQALRIHPHYADAFFKLGVAYQSLRADPDSAIYFYGRAIKEAPGSAIVYNNLGGIYEALGRQELASYYYNMAVRLNPLFAEGRRNSDAHKKKTGLDILIMPVSTDLDSLERATPAALKNDRFYYELGNDHASKGDYANAIRFLEKAVELRPDFVDALVNLGGCYGMLKDYPRSIAVLNKVIAVDPGDVRALSNLAVTYEQMGDKAKAEEFKAKALAAARK